MERSSAHDDIGVQKRRLKADLEKVIGNIRYSIGREFDQKFGTMAEREVIFPKPKSVSLPVVARDMIDRGIPVSENIARCARLEPEETSYNDRFMDGEQSFNRLCTIVHKHTRFQKEVLRCLAGVAVRIDCFIDGLSVETFDKVITYIIGAFVAKKHSVDIRWALEEGWVDGNILTEHHKDLFGKNTAPCATSVYVALISRMVQVLEQDAESICDIVWFAEQTGVCREETHQTSSRSVDMGYYGIR